MTDDLTKKAEGMLCDALFGHTGAKHLHSWQKDKLTSAVSVAVKLAKKARRISQKVYETSIAAAVQAERERLKQRLRGIMATVVDLSHEDGEYLIERLFADAIRKKDDNE
jgi:hypothetical protein